MRIIDDVVVNVWDGYYEEGYYDRLAARCWISEGLLKRTLYMNAYGGAVDPWLWHVIATESLAEERDSAISHGIQHRRKRGE